MAGKRILEIGCGAGGLAALLGLAGATVLGTDRSVPSLKKAVKKLSDYDLQRNVTFVRANAYDLPVKPHSFDLVVTRSVLVVLDRAKMLPYINELLVPDSGIALLVENMDRNPPLRLYRALSRTKWGDFPYFTVPEIKGMDSWFQRVDAHYSGIFSPLAHLGTRSGIGKRLSDGVAPLLAGVDRGLLGAFPALTAYAWIVALRCQAKAISRDKEEGQV
ncbi:MAG: class I SAM-dependent methyltransferase [Anaerolineae bacterium]|nr:class I SAM-dependent methyltransferase [Anaerolineae bacterium]